MILRRQRTALLAFGAVCDLGGAACCALGALLADDTTIALVSIGCALFFLGGFCMWSGWRRLHLPALMLFERPETVIAIRPTQRLLNGVHVQTTYAFHTAEGRMLSLYVLARDEAAASGALRERFPRASFGITP
jgi:hypothetical protein